MGLRAFRSTIDPTFDPTCDLCVPEPQEVEHWIGRYPATLSRRRDLFEPDGGRLDCLSMHPSEAVVLARETLGTMG